MKHPNAHDSRRTLAVLFALLLWTSSMAATVRDGADLYAVTLEPVAAIDGADAAARIAATYGGALVGRDDADGQRFVLRLPATRVRMLANDANVASVVPIATGNDSSQPREVVDWTAGVQFSYDGGGNVRRIGNDAFAYDTAKRLIRADVNGVARGYSYDAVGNRTGCVQPEGDCQLGFTIDSRSNRVREATYDAAGNLEAIGSHSYRYDALNMQTYAVSYGVGREFIYTADDERLAVFDHGTGVWRWSVRDAGGKVLRELTSSGPAGQAQWQWTKDFVWRDGLLLASQQPQSGGAEATRYHYHLDHLGTPRRVTDARDRLVGFHDYLAFGPELPGGLNEPSLTTLKYTGHERDGDGGFGTLDYMHARYYDPALGRFLSVDPLLDLRRNLGEPQNWNRYAYTANNPVNRADPDGRAWDWLPDAAGIIYDGYQLYKEPTWKNAGWLAADIVLGVIPFVPNRGAVMLASDAGTALVRRVGSVTIEGKALQKEIDFAKEMADKGYDVTVRGTNAAGGDLIINGQMFELKTLEAATQNAVEKNVLRGVEQGAGRVIVDGRAAGLSHGTAIRAVNKLHRQGKLNNAEEVRILTATGEYRWTPPAR